VRAGPVAHWPFWQHMNEPHRWLKRGETRYWDCVECGSFVFDMATPTAVVWPWRFNTVGPCAREAPPKPRKCLSCGGSGKALPPLWKEPVYGHAPTCMRCNGHGDENWQTLLAYKVRWAELDERGTRPTKGR
jgi:hypothetical protein